MDFQKMDKGLPKNFVILKLCMIRFYAFNYHMKKNELKLETPNHVLIKDVEEKYKKREDRFKIVFLKPRNYSIPQHLLRTLARFAIKDDKNLEVQIRMADAPYEPPYANILNIGKFKY